MKNPPKSPLATLLAAGLGFAFILPAAAAEKTINVKDAPAAVQKAINDRLKGGKLKTLSVETEGGKTEYEAQITADGREDTLVMDASGKLLETETVIELSALPESARAGLTRAAGKGSIAKVEASTRAGVTSYEALVKESGKKDREVTVGPDGKLIPEKNEKK